GTTGWGARSTARCSMRPSRYRPARRVEWRTMRLAPRCRAVSRDRRGRESGPPCPGPCRARGARARNPEGRCVRSLPLDRQVLLGFAFAALATIVVGALSYQITGRFVETGRQAVHNAELVTPLKRVLAFIYEAE